MITTCFKDDLGERVAKTGYDLSLSDRMTYTAYKFFRGHFDFVTSRGFTVKGVETLGAVRRTTSRFS